MPIYLQLSPSPPSPPTLNLFRILTFWTSLSFTLRVQALLHRCRTTTTAHMPKTARGGWTRGGKRASTRTLRIRTTTKLMANFRLGGVQVRRFSVSRFFRSSACTALVWMACKSVGFQCHVSFVRLLVLRSFGWHASPHWLLLERFLLILDAAADHDVAAWPNTRSCGSGGGMQGCSRGRGHL